jgi:hypothetical protein
MKMSAGILQRPELRARWFAFVALLLTTLFVTPAGAALGAPDQNNPSTSSAQPLDPGTPWTQTFRAGVTGLLTQVDLPIYRERTFPGDPPTVAGNLTISIRATQNATVHKSNGFNYSDSTTVAVPTGSNFAQTTVPAAQISEFTSFSNPPPPLHVTFFLPPLLLAGQTYAIVVEATGTARHDWMISNTVDVNPYPNGNMLFQADGPNTEWYLYTYQPFVGAPHIEYIEAAFTTFMLL